MIVIQLTALVACALVFVYMLRNINADMQRLKSRLEEADKRADENYSKYEEQSAKYSAMKDKYEIFKHDHALMCNQQSDYKWLYNNLWKAKAVVRKGGDYYVVTMTYNEDDSLVRRADATIRIFNTPDAAYNALCAQELCDKLNENIDGE